MHIGGEGGEEGGREAKFVETPVSHGHLAGLRIQLVADAGGATLVLLVAKTLSMYKPRGLTPYGHRKQQEQRTASQP